MYVLAMSASYCMSLACHLDTRQVHEGLGRMWKDKKQQTEGSTTSQSAAVFTECSGVAEK